MSNTLPKQIVNYAPPFRYADGRELRIVEGIVCPQCGVPIRAFDAHRFTNGTMFICCRDGHDILRLERFI
jgi:hypothetical protein